jgi:hypothetical protein
MTGFAPATVPVTLTRANGFTGAVSLAATGLPAFVSASFNPAVIPAGATTSTLTLTLLPVDGLFFGNIPLTVVGSAPGLGTQSSAAVQITTEGGPITFAASPAALTIAAGASGTTTVAITRQPGSPQTTPVALALLTGPEGVTVTQTPRPSTGATATLTLAVAASVPAGQYTVVVRSDALGAAPATLSIPLTVTR